MKTYLDSYNVKWVQENNTHSPKLQKHVIAKLSSSTQLQLQLN